MSELQINTTQNVNINFTAAGLGERILAFLIDAAIITIYLVVCGQIMGNIPEMDQWSEIAIWTIISIPAVFYTLLLESFLDGQTLGKKALKIRVVKIDGYQASFADYLIRWFFRNVDIWVTFGLLAIITLASSKKSQRVGDMAAGTSVITLKDKLKISHTILMELKDDYQPTYPSVIRLSDNDARIIKETFVTAKRAADHATLLKLKTKIEEVIQAKSKHRDTHTFIQTVLKDYNYYTQHM